VRVPLNDCPISPKTKLKDLAQALIITENSVYRLRKVDEMPRLTPERLNGICAAFNWQPGELLIYESDNNADKIVSIMDVA
jgi:putative transcriptional regulator